MRTFSLSGDSREVSVAVLDQAPGNPVFMSDPIYNANTVSFNVKMPFTDFDGTPLTGLDDFWVFAAYNNSDGTNPMDGQTGQNLLDNGYMKVQQGIAGQAGNEFLTSFTVTPPTGGGNLRVVIYVSDGQP